MVLELENILSDFSAYFSSTFISRPSFFYFARTSAYTRCLSVHSGLYRLQIYDKRFSCNVMNQKTEILSLPSQQDLNLSKIVRYFKVS